MSSSKRNSLVEQHLQLVVPIAKSCHRKLPPSFELDDLVQSGMIGLIDAANKWDKQRPFEVYARFRIRGAILDSIHGKAYVEATHVELPLDLAAPAFSTDDTLDLRRACKRLPKPARAVVALHYDSDLPLGRIGSQIGKSRTWVANTRNKALGRLRSMVLRPAA